jgi:hypothetical protein
MSNITNQIVKIELKESQTFAQRQKNLNEAIQRNIDLFNEKGFITLSHSIVNKSDKFASVNFQLQRMISV